MNETAKAHGPDISRPTRILLVNNSADLYGASRCLARILLKLDRDKFLPTVMLPDHGPLEHVVRAMNIQVIIFPKLSVISRSVFTPWKLFLLLVRLPLSILSFSYLLKRLRIDLVHTNTGVILTPGPAAFLVGVPNVWHIRDSFQEFRGMWKFYEIFIRVFSTRILAVSKCIADQFPSQNRVTIVHDGLEVEEFQDPFRLENRLNFRRHYSLGDGPVVGCVGRIKLLRKGQEFLLRAAGMLRRRNIRAKYLIVGAPFEGNETHLDQLHAVVRENELGDDVVFTGELSDPRSAYAAMDILVLPSAQSEPFGGVVTEAMLTGLPVIATNAGGPVEQVVDGETGFLVTPGDAEAIAEKLEVLLGNADMRKRLGEAGCERAVKLFSLRRTLDQIEATYEECLRQK